MTLAGAHTTVLSWEGMVLARTRGAWDYQEWGQGCSVLLVEPESAPLKQDVFKRGLACAQ